MRSNQNYDRLILQLKLLSKKREVLQEIAIKIKQHQKFNI